MVTELAAFLRHALVEFDEGLTKSKFHQASCQEPSSEDRVCAIVFRETEPGSRLEAWRRCHADDAKTGTKARVKTVLRPPVWTGHSDFTNPFEFATFMRMAEGLEAGIIGMNDPVPATPQCPFGGMKESGIGREGGHEGMLDYTETKYIATDW
mgnify:CR=1 FL=1